MYTKPSNQLHSAGEFVSDGSYARFVRIDDVWHMSLAPEMAAMVRVGTRVTCEVETRAGARHTKSGTVVRKRILGDGTARALCRIEDFRRGQPDTNRNTFTRLFSGDWGVKLHAGISSSASVGDKLDVAVTTRKGRVSHLRVRVVHIAETDAGDRAATAVIVSRRNTPEPAYDAAHGVCEPCPTCGTTACNSGIYGACRITPEQHPNQRGDVPLADTPREDFDSRVEPIGRAQDETHWSTRIDRGELDPRDVLRRIADAAGG